MGQDKESVKMDMRQTIVESCALDEEGYMHRRGGEEHGRASRGMLETEHGLFEREKRVKSEGWARIKRE